MIVSEPNEMKQNKQNGETALSERARFLELLSALTRKILLSKDANVTLHFLAYDIKALIGADDSYILSWDEERERTVPITTTAKLDFSFSESTFDEDELDITMSVVGEGRVLTIEDTRNSPHIDVKIAAQFPSRSGIAVPLIAGGQRLGAVVIGYNALLSGWWKRVCNTAVVIG